MDDYENSMNKKELQSSSKDYSWRTNEDGVKAPSTTPRSHGIVSAKACYNTPRDGDKVIHNLKIDIRDRSIQMKKKRIGSAQETKFQAYKQVTTYKTWPVQEQALQHRNELMREYLNEQEGTSHDKAADPSPLVENTTGTAFSASSSSSSADSLLDEPKRVLRDPLLSPAQSRVKCQYQREFMQESRLPKQQQTATSNFAPALWCMEPRLFSYERNKSGKRSYVVAHLGRFLHKYWTKTDPMTRHYYEVIPEHTPCRLYLDLEFSLVQNEALRGDGVAETLMTELFLELQAEFETVYNIQLRREHIVDLDSSTSTKFSRHWILHLPKDVLFPDNITVGAFVKNMVSRLSNEQATKELAMKGRKLLQDYLFVDTSNKTGIQSTCIIDLGVYTRNRLFRLLGSQKFGKPMSAALRIADANKFPFPQGFDNESFYLPAMQESLSGHEVSNDGDASFDFGEAMDQAVEKFVGMLDWSLHAEALALTLIVPMNSSKIVVPLLAPVEQLDSKVNTKLPAVDRPNRCTTALSVGTSPYPMVDNFVMDVLAFRGDVRGSIRAWSVETSENGLARQITYQMSRNRYCECVGRSHKSNNISWTVDFTTLSCTQGCHDPECRRMNFRGTPIELPEDVKEQLADLLFEQALGGADEAELVKSANEADLSFEKALACLNLDELTQQE
ncbi:hypothetical protein MPSEU_000641300 [Mayamaea pseudoterrestris]|nr:hypothetical protein MPSEU_000641300 [Mayamaea pseudoterrestris]